MSIVIDYIFAGLPRSRRAGLKGVIILRIKIASEVSNLSPKGSYPQNIRYFDQYIANIELPSSDHQTSLLAKVYSKLNNGCESERPPVTQSFPLKTHEACTAKIVFIL